MATPLSASSETVTVIMNPDNLATRFQAIAYGTGNESPRTVHACQNQGDMTSWLACNGYQWIKDSKPQQWVKKA